MNLIIDVGNSLVKVAFFKGDEVIEIRSFIEASEAIEFILQVPTKFHNAIVSTVRKESGFPVHLLNHREPLFFTSDTPIPIKNGYKSLQTLGVDRLAAVIGGKKILQTANVLVIDCGTCITYDLLLNNEYLGGAIAPGVSMKFKALNTFTDNLPLVTLIPEVPNRIGDDTMSSIRSGVINGTISEINQTIEEYRRNNNNLAVILTGGDSVWLKDKVKNTQCVEPNLVLIGLNEILKYNSNS